MEKLSIVHGAEEPALWSQTLGQLVEEQATQYGDRTALVTPWQDQRLSFRQLADSSQVLASAMVQAGLRLGDCIAVLAGNRYEYIQVFLAGARIGCPVLPLNNAYTPAEVLRALQKSATRFLFLASQIGPRSLAPHLQTLLSPASQATLPELSGIVCFDSDGPYTQPQVQGYGCFLASGERAAQDEGLLPAAERIVRLSDNLSYQFTSGTSGEPKLSMLTHRGLINNARLVGDGMCLTPADVVCCPPPLFHTFGLVLGFLNAFTHGSAIVFPSDHFHADSVIDAVIHEKATALLGVPTMFVAELEACAARKLDKITTVRTGLAAGSPVSETLLSRLEERFGVKGMLIAYGMTETSPVTFMTSLDDPRDKAMTSLGRVLPHTSAKVINQEGVIVPRGESGELCTSGYGLQRGYFENEAKTKEAMQRDADGRLWMHTGDQCYLDAEGYCHISGRMKDVIIRGGENMFPLEIEERLLLHPAIAEASVVGVADPRYGEVVGCFLKLTQGHIQPQDQELRDWVRVELSWHKAPQHVFWIGDGGVCPDFPKTASGKHQKHIMREIANMCLSGRRAGKDLPFRMQVISLFGLSVCLIPVALYLSTLA
ncbi:acetyl-CoA synthetase-like protein [Aspergillus aculeatinus CBS 121060]|uniref:Acetyl-CoA synthetase-like protein n=1 Tax=Aspergillus aculeatinus CBS 121060 TaxID=1448322 RepID=A0ACD1H9G0_9EURO|nr:acetyl-CoA synthetase-like protein [Aspergillus aculeatinus CBS 121060]RAH70044.1 acetyl-CoA synthetase-like protein [Aspergillus aculeatinus CBS 121060]